MLSLASSFKIYVLHTSNYHHHCNVNLRKHFVFALLKLVLNIFSAASVLSLIPKVGPSLDTKKLFFQLTV